jgi:hypothetical protein
MTVARLPLLTVLLVLAPGSIALTAWRMARTPS